MYISRFGTGLTIFALFFGVALLESLESGNWIRAAFWIAIGLVFFAASNQKGSKIQDQK